MRAQAKLLESFATAQLWRFIVNRLAATTVCFAVVTFNLHVLTLRSVGLANLLAAVFGISASFLGSRYFVFRNAEENVLRQAYGFGALYSAIAALHRIVLHAWSDIAGYDYRVGFFDGNCIAVNSWFFGSKFLVFRT